MPLAFAVAGGPDPAERNAAGALGGRGVSGAFSGSPLAEWPSCMRGSSVDHWAGHFGLVGLGRLPSARVICMPNQLAAAEEKSWPKVNLFARGPKADRGAQPKREMKSRVGERRRFIYLFINSRLPAADGHSVLVNFGRATCAATCATGKLARSPPELCVQLF